MATTIQSDKIIRTEFLALQNRIKAELTRRGQASTSNDYLNEAAAGSQIKKEHYEKIAKNVHIVNANEPFPDLSSSDALTDNALVKESHVVTADGFITAHEAKNLGSTSGSDCSSGCVGACVTACKTLCTGTCTGSCSGCSGTCSGGCSGCKGTCGNTCAGSGCLRGCDSGCSNTSTNATPDCGTSCSGGCGNGCSKMCSGGCWSCTSTCNGCSGTSR
ncbi:MAG: hypothetical protein LBB94_10085 [Clostridiales bacterium]|nr:hypothetical protein [Clostridiales bacterium]